MFMFSPDRPGFLNGRSPAGGCRKGSTPPGADGGVGSLRCHGRGQPAGACVLLSVPCGLCALSHMLCAVVCDVMCGVCPVCCGVCPALCGSGSTAATGTNIPCGGADVVQIVCCCHNNTPHHTLFHQRVQIVAKQISDFPITTIRFSPYDPLTLVSCGRENVRFWRIKVS